MKLLLLLLWFIFSAVGPHPLYLSICSIEVENSREWRATFHLFYDDLEDALHNQDGIRPTLTSENLALHQATIQKYLSHHFRLQSKHNMTYFISDLTRENDVILVDIIGNESWPLSSISITNNILLELFEAQKNILKIKTEKKEDILAFRKNATQLEYSNE